MRLENILRGMTIPGVVPQHRQENVLNQLPSEDKALFLIQNLVGEIVRLHKLLCKMKSQRLNPDFAEICKNANQSAIAKAWGVSRNLFPELLEKIQNTGTLKRQRGTGATVSVMTEAVKRKLIDILVKNKGDIDFTTWEEEISKDKRFKLTPKRESIRRWWIKECGGIYVLKKSRPMISKETARLRVEYCKKCLANEEFSPQIHQDEGFAYTVRWCRKLKTIKPGMVDEFPDGYKPPKQASKSRRHTPKVLLSIALARPEKKEGVGFYGGTIEMLRCARNVVAKRTSKNHKKGSIYQQDASLNSTMFKEQLTKKFFPAIKKNASLLAKSERFANQLKTKNQEYSLPEGCKWADLFFQFDNAPPHCSKNKRLTPIIRKAAARNVVNGAYFGPKVRIQYQPPDSPDLNVLDLGFFSKFWIMIHKILKNYEHVPTVDDVWEAAQVAWKSVSPVDIEILFRTLYSRMEHVIECNGRNDMPILHGQIRKSVEAEDKELKKIENSS